MKLTLFFLLAALAAADEPDNAWVAQDADQNTADDFDGWDELIAGGHRARPGAYPFFATVGTRSRALCGASLINPNWALTAAHCSGAWQVGGEIRVNIHKFGGNSGVETRRLARVIPHPRYSDRGLPANDIMLLKLDRPIYNIEPVQLESNEQAPRSGQDLTLIGFGKLGTNQGVSKTLMELELTGGRCRDEVKFCAQASRADACGGDSGGPIFDTRTKVQIGLVSYGSTDCDAGHSGYYTRIAHYRDWINGYVGGGNPSPPSGNDDQWGAPPTPRPTPRPWWANPPSTPRPTPRPWWSNPAPGSSGSCKQSYSSCRSNAECCSKVCRSGIYCA